MRFSLYAILLATLVTSPGSTSAQVAIRGETIYTSASDPIRDGMIVIRDGKISTIGKAEEINVPDGFKVLTAKVVDARPHRCTLARVGLSGILNYEHDQDQLEHSNPIQPELRAIDAYNAHEELIAWVRSFGVTTIHTGHAPGELISGQTFVAKTTGNTVDDAMLSEATTVAATLSTGARKSGAKSPGTRGKMVAMLRSELIKAQEYTKKHDSSDENDQDAPARDLRMEALSKVLSKELPLLVTAHKAQDINNALRLAKEFDLRLWLDGAAESYLLIDEIKAAGVPVIIHPTMLRPNGELENFSFETASKLVNAGIPVSIQAGYEAYVPKTRVVLFEAAMAAANGLSFQQALNAITIDPAKMLGVEQRIGSLEVGKDGDVALYDGDPFEYDSHCIGVVIQGEIVSQTTR